MSIKMYIKYERYVKIKKYVLLCYIGKYDQILIC